MVVKDVYLNISLTKVAKVMNINRETFRLVVKVDPQRPLPQLVENFAKNLLLCMKAKQEPLQKIVIFL